jgi:hypothetical protein
MDEHPVRLVVEDDLRRSRVTVFFRLLLAIPHFIWVFLWSIAIVFAAIANWVATLAAGRPPEALHRFMCAYIRYVTHLNAYFWLVANPYPGFVGEEGEYPVDVMLPPPVARDPGDSVAARRRVARRLRIDPLPVPGDGRAVRFELRRRARRCDGVPRLVREPRPWPDAEGASGRRRL